MDVICIFYLFCCSHCLEVTVRAHDDANLGIPSRPAGLILSRGGCLRLLPCLCRPICSTRARMSHTRGKGEKGRGQGGGAQHGATATHCPKHCCLEVIGQHLQPSGPFLASARPLCGTIVRMSNTCNIIPKSCHIRFASKLFFVFRHRVSFPLCRALLLQVALQCHNHDVR